MKVIAIKSKFGRFLASILVSMLLLTFFAEACYVALALLSPDKSNIFLAPAYIPLFYFSAFSLGSNGFVEILLALILWFAYWVAFVTLRLGEQSLGVKSSILKAKYVVLTTCVLSAITLVFGMYAGSIIMLMLLPAFMFIPLNFPSQKIRPGTHV